MIHGRLCACRALNATGFIGDASLCGLGPGGVMIILGAIEGLLALNAKIFRHAGYGIHHDYESWPGLLVVVLRLALAALLWLGPLPICCRFRLA